MSVSNAESYARRAKNETNEDDRAKYFAKAIDELAQAIKHLESEVQRLKSAVRS